MKNLCHICNNETSYLLAKDNFPLFKCSGCGLVYMNPLPQQNFLNKDIYSAKSGYQSNKIKDLFKAIPDKKTNDILDFLTKNNIKGRLLDVGCSSGEFLYHAKKRGFDPYGVELNKRTADIAIQNGLNVFNGLLTDIKYKYDFFDVIFLGDIIEHVLSPRDFVLECKRILKPQGLILISTPNLDCLWSKFTFLLNKVFRIPWSSVTPPYHTFQFSENNLDLLMFQNKFSKVKIWFNRPPRLMYELGSLHLLKRYRNKKTFLNLFFLLFSSSIYAVSYFFVVGTRLLRRSDFSMVSIYKKNE